MIPPHLASAAFRLFVSIPKSRIGRDIAQGPDGYRYALRFTQDFLGSRDQDVTAEHCAEYLHEGMIAGCLAKVHPRIHRDIAFWFAGIGMRCVANAAVHAAQSKGELGQLYQDLDRICADSGNEDYDDLPEGEQTPEYVEKARRAANLMSRIEEMVAVDTLRRYGLHEEADLLETDGPSFSERMSRGQRLLSK